VAVMWYYVGTDDDNAVCILSLLHWHCLQVAALQVTREEYSNQVISLGHFVLILDVHGA
jgi:hypothetical protein